MTPKSQERNVRSKKTRKAAAAEVPSEGEYIDFDGTEYAAAHVAGAVAALLSVRRDLIGKPKEVKDILLRTAVDLDERRCTKAPACLMY